MAPASLALFSFLIVSSAILIAVEGQERRTQLHFYFHEISAGPNTTVVRVAQANTTDASPNLFGAVAVADNLLTEGPEPTSRLVGRAQGMYPAASQEEFATLMAINFVFTEREYNGSVLTMLGRNPVASAVREIPIVGGTGYFRLARGYAILRTRRFDTSVGLVTVEYNITVFHPSL